jgi:hypothetical protein
MQAQERQNGHDDDDQTDEVNYSIHDMPPAQANERRRLLTQNRSAVAKFLSRSVALKIKLSSTEGLTNQRAALHNNFGSTASVGSII